MSFSNQPFKKKRSPKPSSGEPKKPRASQEKKVEPPPKHVRFDEKNLMKVIPVPQDQDNPIDIWNVYAHVAYTTRKEQRFLQRCLSTRIYECVEHFPQLFPDQPDNRDKDQGSKSGRVIRKIDGPFMEHLAQKGYGKNIAACALYVMSVWPSFPASQRPPLSPRVQKSMEAVQAGTRLYVFNEKPNSPLMCGTALRMLHSIDADEASIAIFNPAEGAVIDGYIPLSFVVSLSFGLEPVEKEHYLKKNGKIQCTDGDKKSYETTKRAFTVHCAAPEKFYVTFVAVNQEDFENWTRVIDYFVLLSACCRTYIQAR